MADHALAALWRSRVREVVVLGRRGAAQASFTTPEVRELGRIEGVDVAVDPADIELDEASRAGMEGTGRFEVVEAGLVLRSIGYRTVPIEGVPFDPATSTLNNIAGQVVHPSTGEVAPGEYVAGWAKRGPTGKIGNNKPDSASTVAAMLADVRELNGVGDDHRDPGRLDAFLRGRGVDTGPAEGGPPSQAGSRLGTSRHAPRLHLWGASVLPRPLRSSRKG
jgi:hypothetical protein